MSQDNVQTIDYTNKDYQALRAAMLALATEKLPEWTDHSANDLGVVLLELFAYMGDILLYYQDRIANESYLDTAVERQSIVNLLRLIGYELRPSTPASADLTLLFKQDATGTVTVPKGAMFQTTAKATGEPIGFQFIREDQDIDLDSLDRVEEDYTNPDDGNTYKRLLSTLPVVQVDAAVSSEILGSSDGSVGQRFRLRRKPVIEDQLELYVDEGNGWRLWQRRDSLLSSLANDPHYCVRREEGEVTYVELGDGRHGKIPGQGRNNITATYRVGGGSRGNVPAKTIVKKVTPITSLAAVFNAEPATGGADAEASQEAVLRGPQLFKAQERAVTADDYEAHAKAFGVGKARARPANWNRVELFVAPVGGGQPTDTLKEDLRNYFEDRRIMTTLLDIRDPSYVNVCIAGTLEINAYRFTEQVQQQVADAVAALLAFENVDFEHTIYVSKLYEAIEAVDGVEWVEVTRLSRSGTSAASDLPENGRLLFGWNEIPRGRTISWRQSPTEPKTWLFGEKC